MGGVPGGGGFLIAQECSLVGNEPGFFRLDDLPDDLHGSDGGQVIRIAPGDEDCAIGNLRYVQAKIAGKAAHQGGIEVRVDQKETVFLALVNEVADPLLTGQYRSRKRPHRQQGIPDRSS